MENMNNQHSMDNHASKSGDHSKQMYKRFALMAIAMYCVMYLLMYSMIDHLENLVFNLNNIYMTLLMTSAMLLLEILIMKEMYANKRLNWIIVGISVAFGLFSWFGIREQIGVGNKQFVKGMIPHHAAAVLMSEKANLTDPELIELQKNILKTQAQEIEFMKTKLKQLESKE